MNCKYEKVSRPDRNYRAEHIKCTNNVWESELCLASQIDSVSGANLYVRIERERMKDCPYRKD